MKQMRGAVSRAVMLAILAAALGGMAWLVGIAPILNHQAASWTRITANVIDDGERTIRRGPDVGGGSVVEVRRVVTISYTVDGQPRTATVPNPTAAVGSTVEVWVNDSDAAVSFTPPAGLSPATWGAAAVFGLGSLAVVVVLVISLVRPRDRHPRSE